MKTCQSLAIATLASVLCLPFANAQQAGTSAAQPATKARVRQEPCWKQVGISESAKQERDAVASDRRSQVEAVCADTSLNAQQKKQKIHEIRQQAKQKIESLITPEQEQQLQSCQKERSPGHPASVGAHPAGAGPCGEVTTGAAHPKPGTSPGGGAGQ